MNFKFDVSVYGDSETISPTLSKRRVRIFYTGLNRNRTYISDEFADKLLATLPYTPICGKYDGKDFTNHGDGSEQLQIYGVVPENPNIQWELHEDKDGVERLYACADVLLYTARFPEAEQIGEKGQSMEIYDKSVKGQWVYQNGKQFFKFTDGCFIGLAALGDNTEPCFEGAAFYAYKETLETIIEELNKYTNKGGQESMELKFKLSDSQKLEALFSLLNTKGYFENMVCDVYDDYALCYNYEKQEYFRAYYTKDNETDSIEITNQETVYVLDITETEYEAIKKLQATGNTFTEIEKGYAEYKNNNNGEGDEPPASTDNTIPVEQYEKEKAKFEAKIAELDTQISELNSQISTYKVENEKISQENETLNQYKLDIENKEKETILDKYSKVIAEEKVNEFKEKLANYSLDNLEKELAVEAVNFNSQVLFSNGNLGLLPNGNFETDNEHYSGAERMLAQHMKKKNGGNI